jgi:multimeric flavodoxin WrbA
MKHITIFSGSARSGHSYRAIERFLSELKKLREISYEIIKLSDFTIEYCVGCKRCFEKGEMACPLKDDVLSLARKMEQSDAVIFASPNYGFHISGKMKSFIDRIAYNFHRPQFFGKYFTSIIVQGIYGAGKIRSYFHFIAPPLGFNSLPGVILQSLEPLPEKVLQKNEKKIVKHAQAFAAFLDKPAFPAPSFIDVMMFRISRTKINTMLDDGSADYRYFKKKGWFEKDFYYPAKLGLFGKFVGFLSDRFAGNS